MPTIEVSRGDLCNLIGRRLSMKQLEEAVLYAKCEIDSADGDTLKLDCKDTNRPDLWSAEGVAREMAGRLGRPGLPAYRVGKSGVRVLVNPRLKAIRPYTVCAVVRNLNMTPDVLSQMIQLQEKVSMTFGRNRKEVAIGVYDLHRITSPIKFTTTAPDGIMFMPLEFSREMTPAQILKSHPKGREFGHLLEGMREYPVFIDSAGEVLSMPPIINSDYTGKVTRETRDIFIECSGFNLRFLLPALNVIASALADRGGKVETVEIDFGGGKKLVTPDLSPRKTRADLDFINKVSGLKLSMAQARKLLEQARYAVKAHGRRMNLLYPAYRQDIMHMRDVAEDAVISYGYNRIEPVPPRLATIGKTSDMETFSDRCARIMVGLGYQEILSYILTSKGKLFTRMLLPESDIVEIENYVSENWNVFRNSLLPGMLEFLSRNNNQEYPQRIFEIGECVLPDPRQETRTRDVRKLSLAFTGNSAGYQDASGALEALLSNLGVPFSLRARKHPSFIPGRCADVLLRNRPAGMVGEIHPQVLNNFGLKMPVAALELDVQELNALSKN